MKKQKFYENKKDTIYIYGIRALASNVIFYVGVTTRTPEVRLKEHIRKNRYKDTAVNELLYEEFKRIFNSGSSVIVETLYEIKQGIFESYNDINIRKHAIERDFIKLYNPKCNKTKTKKRKKVKRVPIKNKSGNRSI